MLRRAIGLGFVLASCTAGSASSVASPDASRPERPSHDGDAGDLTDAGRDDQAQGPSADRAPQPLIDLMLLRRVEDADEDPMREHRPEQIVCNEDGAYVEDGQLEIDTGGCNYSSFTASAQRAVAAGQMVTIHITHFDLTSPEPAQAHLALFASSEMMWETYVGIPRRADVIDARFEVPSAIVRGEPITFHLHNHGQNTWRLVGVEVVPTSTR